MPVIFPVCVVAVDGVEDFGVGKTRTVCANQVNCVVFFPDELECCTVCWISELDNSFGV